MKPLYMLIKEKIEADMHSGKLKSGDRLPSEIVLAAEFKVSRETVRSAIRLLEENGKVYVKHGVGTFVVNPLPKTPNSLEQLMSVTSMIKYAGLEDGEKREKIKLDKPTEEWKNLLQLKEDEEVIIHERIRTANDEPVVFSQNVIAESLVKKKMINQGSIGSLFDYLKKNAILISLELQRKLLFPFIQIVIVISCLFIQKRLFYY
ncbi:GntR family transcriptional regulator [Niallia taxi]|nr:GntR family transcriptional regulator [Niallia taxi]MDK8641795.1 GntR family transcriptional regulator [Niallia taxi]